MNAKETLALTDGVIDRLTELGTTLTDMFGAPMFDALVTKYHIEGWSKLAACVSLPVVGVIITSILMLVATRVAKKERRVYEQELRAYEDEKTAKGIRWATHPHEGGRSTELLLAGCVVFIVSTAIGFTLLACSLHEITTKISVPEYYAIQDILRSVGG